MTRYDLTLRAKAARSRKPAVLLVDLRAVSIDEARDAVEEALNSFDVGPSVEPGIWRALLGPHIGGHTFVNGDRAEVLIVPTREESAE